MYGTVNCNIYDSKRIKPNTVKMKTSMLKIQFQQVQIQFQQVQIQKIRFESVSQKFFGKSRQATLGW